MRREGQHKRREGTTSHNRREGQDNKKNQNFTNCSWFISTCWHVPSWLRVWVRPSQRVWLQDSGDRGDYSCRFVVNVCHVPSWVGVWIDIPVVVFAQQFVPPKGRGCCRTGIEVTRLAAKKESDCSTTHHYVQLEHSRKQLG